MKSVKIVFTFFLLWITTQFDLEVENFLAYFFILSLGVLHGSNDLKLVRSINGVKAVTSARILFLYIGIVIIIFVVFLLVPKIGLALFIFISSYHFGEQHLYEKSFVRNKGKNIVFTLYGLLIFFMIFYTNYEDVSVIVQDIANIVVAQAFYKYVLIFLFILLSITIVVFRNAQLSLQRGFEELIYLILFYILFINSTLLWSFAIYFIVWHSVPSLKDQLLRLYGKISFRNVLKYLKESFLYWVVSIVGIFILTIFTKEDERLFNLLFVALFAAITFPHVLILGKMHKPD